MLGVVNTYNLYAYGSNNEEIIKTLDNSLLNVT